ncbi:unnamed protein product [Cladocopium goreaui]|uniref:Uncharacterized protein n=1 Tax=Cladocopium goreaui TaxID=2562237 RepID=A0A9P1D6I6_9DINO|nr:unnamed protein product [Cladocopium goreaui]
MGTALSAAVCVCQRRCGQNPMEVEVADDLVSHMVSNVDGNGMETQNRPALVSEGFPLPMTAAKPWGAPSSQEDLRRMQLAHQKEHEEQMRLHLMRLKEHLEHQQRAHQFHSARLTGGLNSNPTLLQGLHPGRSQVASNNVQCAKPPAEVLKPPAVQTQIAEGGLQPESPEKELLRTEVPIVMFDDIF